MNLTSLQIKLSDLFSASGFAISFQNPRHKQIVTGSLILAAGAALTKTIGIAKQMVIAAWFGTSNAIDAFYMALLVCTFVTTVTGTALGSAAIPTYIQEKQRNGADEAQKLVSEGTLLSVVLFGLLAVAAIFCGPFLLTKIAGSYGTDQLILTRNLFYILIPCIIFCGPIYFWSAIYNAENRYALPALGPATASAVTVLLVLTAGWWGAYALATGTALGFAAHALLLWAGNTNLRMSFSPNWYGIRRSSVQIGRQYSPMLAATLLHNSSMLVDQTMAANLGTGCLTAFNYSSSVIFAFLSIGASVVGTVFLPHFSAMIARGNKPEAHSMLKLYSVIVLLGSIPVAGAIFFFAEPIVRLIFERGEFSRNDTIIVAQLVQMFSVQIPFYLLGILGVRFLSAELNNAFTFRISLLGAILNIGLNLLFIELMGLKGIALSTSIVYAVTTSLIFGKIMLSRFSVRPQEIV